MPAIAPLLPKRQALAWLAAACTAVAGSGPASAGETDGAYPERTVTLVVPAISERSWWRAPHPMATPCS